MRYSVVSIRKNFNGLTLMTFERESVRLYEFNLESLVKGDFKHRVHALFTFYDIEGSNGISYDELLMMVKTAKDVLVVQLSQVVAKNHA